MAKIKKSQSQNPATGKRITYNKSVQGAKMMPRIGQRIEPPKAIRHKPGQKSHQTKAAIRGPNRTRDVRKQHIAFLLANEVFPLRPGTH
jgi:hypothetical protein